MSINPYAAPKSKGPTPDRESWQAKLLAPFLSSVISIPLGFVLIGALRRAPALFERLDFFLLLLATSTLSALILKNYRSAGWLVRAILAPPISFILGVLTLVMMRVVAA